MRPVSAIGVGQMRYRQEMPEKSAPEMVFEVVQRALEDARCDPDEIDAVVFASAPEVFEGVHEPDRWCVEAYAGIGKETLRIHTGGATGGSGALAGARLVAAGRCERVLVVGLQRTGEAADAQQIFTTIFDPVYEQDVQLNVITTIAMMASRQLELFGLTEEHMAWVAAKNFQNARLNPMSHLQLDVSMDDVKASRMLASPLRLLHTCPRSEGACAVVFASEEAARNAPSAAWIRGTGSAADVYRIGDRLHDEYTDFAEQRALAWACSRAYEQAGISDPLRQIDVAEVYSPFSNIEVNTYETMGFAPRGEGWRLVEEEATTIDGPMPVCPSGGCQTSNPIGATGLVRFAEAVLQVTGRAGDHQVDGAKVALATATGGINQFFTAAVVASSPGD